jgi:hypothetical protein
MKHLWLGGLAMSRPGLRTMGMSENKSQRPFRKIKFFTRTAGGGRFQGSR